MCEKKTNKKTNKLLKSDEKEKDLNDYWTSPTVVIKNIGPKLVPFFKTVAIYLVLADRESPSWLTCVLKCLPIIWLCIFVVMHGISLGDKHMYSRRILFGLILSCLGDAILVWPKYFLWGMFAFGMAHIVYISAFGFHPINLYAGVVCGVVGALVHYLMYPGLQGTIFSITVPVYNIVLLMMVWRAVARVQLFGDLWTWTKLCSCFGGILFAISDTVLGLREFGIISNIIDPRHCQLLVMLTYYAAQFGISLSVVDSKAMAVLSAANEAERMSEDIRSSNHTQQQQSCHSCQSTSYSKSYDNKKSSNSTHFHDIK